MDAFIISSAFLATLSALGNKVTIPLQDTALVIAMAIGVNLLYAFGRRRFTNIEKMRRYNAEMKAFRSELSAAVKSGDKVKQERLKKKQQQMQKMQAEMSFEQMKPSLLFMIPLFGVYYLVNSFIGRSILVITPITIPPVINIIALNYFWWYFICSFTFSPLISRLFGLTMD